MTSETFDRNSWERRWAQALRDHADVVATRPPNAHLLAAANDLPPGLALDAGCGHGAETLWLAAHGWRITALDFAETVLEHCRARAETLGADIAERVDWVHADLSTWTPPPSRFNLVISLYVHVAGSVTETVRRLASGVAPGGTLLLVGHRPIDPATGKATAAAGQTQISVGEAVAALDPAGWEILLAEDQPRPALGSGVDAVVRARRSPA
ncbi:methyltransferase domain-containing protein [Actinoplanes sp. NBC_00393]|uniref:class I SAM-dependent methyltransferase n=1 Tax=Actinoplanes sp. NBC_00393 TaxID=2975953 RepID=UPI002E2503AE